MIDPKDDCSDAHAIFVRIGANISQCSWCSIRRDSAMSDVSGPIEYWSTPARNGWLLRVYSRTSASRITTYLVNALHERGFGPIPGGPNEFSTREEAFAEGLRLAKLLS